MTNSKNDGQSKYIVATDVGGTCTDTIVIAEGEQFYVGKSLSTPPDFANGVMDSIEVAAKSMDLSVEDLFAQTYLFMHGSTVVDNTLLTRDGSTTGLITTAGFEDTLLVTRGAYGRWAGQPEEWIKHPVATDRPAPLVSPDTIQGVRERTDYKGEVLLPVDDAGVEHAVRTLIDDKKVDAIAVCFLWSFYNDENERRVGDIINRIAPDTYVTLSSAIAPTLGEYERTSTAVINAYAGSITRGYITNLQELLSTRGYSGPLMVMQGYGGLLPADEAADRAVGMIECGPAAGVIGAKALGDLMGDRDIIAADMGGTTFKVGVIQDGEIEYAREPMVDRYHYVAPKIEVVSIGAGGGSIVSIDPKTKTPKVGPRSAGADPGPVCYGRGGEEITLTDVFTLVGYMDPDTFLGGAMTLDMAAARSIFEQKIAAPLGLSVAEAAFGIFRVAAAQITDLIHEITIERGLDPRDYVLHAFGGSCPILASMFGAELNVKRIVIPSTAAVNCAFGLVSADIVHEYSVTTTLPADAEPDAINKLYEPMVAKATEQLRSEGFIDGDIRLDWSVDLRYARQVHELTTTVNGATPMDTAAVARLIDDFEALYERKYGKGSAYREAGIEMKMFRLSASGLLKRPEIETEKMGPTDASGAKMGRREIFVDARGGMAEADIFDFTKLHAGNQIAGPAVIHTPITTIVVQDHQGKLVAWSACFVHVYDIGAANPGGFSPDSPDIFTEGFSSPGIRLVEKGELRNDVLDTLLNMVRSPEMVALDIRSMIACNNVAKDRMHRLIDKYGHETVDEACGTLIDQSETLLRDRLRELPNGRWQSRQYLNVKDDVFRVVLTMTKQDDELVFDFTGSSDQAKYAINCTKWASLGGLFAPLFPLLCYDITWNEGVIKPVTMIAPEGSIVNCIRPAPVSVATVGAIQSVNNAACATIGKMLEASETYAKEATAVWHANHFAVFKFGRNQYGGEGIGIFTETFAGSGGARTFADGVDVGGEIPNPISRMANVETVEAGFPIRYLFRRRMIDSGGAGKYRGGTGMEFAVVPHDAPDGGIHYVVSGKGDDFPMSDGLSGGYPGAPNGYIWAHNNDVADSDKNTDAKFALSLDQIPGEQEAVTWGVFPLMGEDSLYIRWNGGGGFGDPLERDPEAVLEDYLNKMVSLESACRIYGVEFGDGNRVIDNEKTTALREDLYAQRDTMEAAE